MSVLDKKHTLEFFVIVKILKQMKIVDRLDSRTGLLELS